MTIGLLRNGGTEFAGRAAIDLDFLLGKNGGHLNVNGIAGLGTKSTLLMTMNLLLLREAARQKKQAMSDPNRLQIVPVVFNVKNFDLFFIDRWNKDFRKNEAENRDDVPVVFNVKNFDLFFIDRWNKDFRKNEAENRDEWLRTGVDSPTPFEKPRFFAPQQKGLETPIPAGGRTTHEGHGVLPVDIEGAALVVPIHLPIPATPFLTIEVVDSETELPTLAEKYPQHDSAIVKLTVHPPSSTSRDPHRRERRHRYSGSGVCEGEKGRRRGAEGREHRPRRNPPTLELPHPPGPPKNYRLKFGTEVIVSAILTDGVGGRQC